VLAELEAYAPLVSPGSCAVAMDGHIMELAVGLPRSAPDWATNNPKAAAQEFVRAHPDFVIDDPGFAFDESLSSQPVSYFAGGVVRRLR
jgi:cephalosporin hydroxylase